MPIRFAFALLGVTLFLNGCAGTFQCDEDRVEPYMEVDRGSELDPGDLDFQPDPRGRFDIPGEERVDRARANPCLAQSPRIVDPPTPEEREVREAQAFADLRVRVETLSQDGFDLGSTANTMRLRLGGTTPRVAGFDAGIAFQTNQVLDDIRYADSTGAQPNRPVIRDPADTGVSEGWGRYVTAGDGFEVKVGRQALRHDNQRFVGSSSFRQLEQTYNAAAFRFGTGETWQLDAQHLSQGITPLGPNNPDRSLGKMDVGATLLDFSRQIGDSQLGLYAHHVDFDDQRVSHQNLGLRLHGRLPWTERFDYRLELAEQSDLRGTGPEDGLGYYHLKLGQSLDDWRWYAGQERLEGDGELGYQTPLGSTHEFNGWVDRFLTIPSLGLVDNYAGVVVSRWGWDFESRMHQFRVENGSGGYGEELGIRAGRSLGDNLRVDIGYSRYFGEDNDAHGYEDLRGDSRRSWISLGAEF
ncbi:hypothetical protein J2T60_000451 [Natronospira proteinivora]|uniref:Alginate export domain-containing protein n=1 Tax=Natronospira proteinivora TaxID=1807133 RepID=A0ABT1G598_9GAMM|nr:alginate export family protein [Natronospira proteinivora]MCP1726486.1 hypothetical protein [Natronospira proteinivora]